MGLKRVVWIPAGQPWRKAASPVTPAEHRVAMVELAIAGNSAFKRSRVEVDREGPSYTAETLAALAADARNAEHVLIMGQDALADLPNWREPERVVELATVAVARRVGRKVDGGELERRLPGLLEKLVWIDMDEMAVSATDIRRRVAEGRSIRYLVPDAVREYIEEEGLYREA